MAGKSKKRAVGLHLEVGRRYEHADLTAHRPRSRRVRKKAELLHQALDAVAKRYATELHADENEALHGAVVRLLRPEIQADWTPDRASTRALYIAARLLETLPTEEDEA